MPPPPPPPADAVAVDLPARRGGTIAAALSHRAFRWVFLGMFASNIGTWMQNFTLGALADNLTGKAWFIGLVTFAQLGPILFLSPLAGVLADTFDRKRLLITTAAFQCGFSVALAVVARSGDPSPAAIVALVGGVGVATACAAPTMAATLPSLVGRRDLAGAISLNSAQMNASRVVGPLAAGLLVGIDRPALIFAVNAATYLFVIAALALVDFDSAPPSRGHEPAMERLRIGLRATWNDPVLTRVLVTVSLFSLCSLLFIYQLHPFALGELGGDERTFTLLFSFFGLGAAIGALAVGSVFASVSRPRLTRISLAVFAVSLGALSVQAAPGPAYVAAFATGLSYFVAITSLSTILQEEVPDAVRGRVMGLWMMAWAGLVPLGSLIGGPIIDVVGRPAVFGFGALVALALVAYFHVDLDRDDGPVVLPSEGYLRDEASLLEE